jgi:drug/metabolite transporter (DMT)-like permease
VSSHNLQRPAAFLSLALSTSLIGSYIGLSKLLLLAFPVFLLAWLRFGIAAVAMLGWIRRGPETPQMDRRTQGLVFLESFLGNFLFSICLLFGVGETSAMVTGVLMAGIPAAVALLSWLFLRERIAGRVRLGIALSVAGIALVALDRGGNSGAGGDTQTSLLGAMLVLAAVFCEASYVVIGKRLTQNLSPKRISALINLWGLALVTPFGIWQAWSFDFAAVEFSNWGLLLFYALAASIATVWLWMRGLRHVPAAQASVFMVFLPISTALIGFFVLGESISAVQALAYAIALAGVVLASWPAAASDAQPLQHR